MHTPSGRAPQLTARLGWEAHLAAHQVFDEHVDLLHGDSNAPLRTMVRAVHLRLQLVDHIRFEEREIVPRLDDEGVRANVLRDHDLIRDGLGRLEEVSLLAHFRRVDSLRVRQRLVELDRLLDHHDDREERDVYGWLATELADDERAEVLTRFETTTLLGPLGEGIVSTCVTDATMEALSARYRAWLDGRDLPAASEVPVATLPMPARKNLPKLLTRDDRVVAAQRKARSRREHARSEQLADVALRSSITVVVDALVRNASGSA